MGKNQMAHLIGSNDQYDQIWQKYMLITRQGTNKYVVDELILDIDVELGMPWYGLVNKNKWKKIWCLSLS